MTPLPIVATILLAAVLIVALYRTTRHRRPQWAVCEVCERRTIFINGVGRWLHVIGDVDSAYDAMEPHTPSVRRGSVHLRRT